MFWSNYNEYSKNILIFENWEEIFVFVLSWGSPKIKFSGRIKRMKMKEYLMFAKG